jgi:hypothetical protein
MTPPRTSDDLPAEPRAATMLDLMVATIGMSCAFALPSGLNWFSLQATTRRGSLEFVTDVGLWACCVAAVGGAFAIAGRHYRYDRGARPAEWLVISIATVYLSLAFTELHAEYSSLSMLVSKMETGSQTELGPLLSVACALFLFAIVGGYVGLLMWQGKLSPLLKTLLGAALVLFWYWGPCDVWSVEWLSILINWDGGWESVTMMTLVPELPLLFVPMVLLFWAIWSWKRAATWWLMEYAGVVLFGLMAALLYFHPAVQRARGTPTFFVEIVVFSIVVTAVATVVGWGLALLDKLVSAQRHQTPTAPRVGASGNLPYNDGS